ncbi:hypothetical protein ABPG75_002360 [Micractinium tetrahymenae]
MTNIVSLIFAVLGAVAWIIALGGLEVIVRWRPEELPATSGCDSSDCAYCGALARLRRPGASPPRGAASCWLRRKRAIGQAEGFGQATPCSSCGEEEEEEDEDGEERARRWRASHAARFPRVPSTGTLAAAAGVGAPGSSIWDHALLLEEPLGEQAGQPGLWHMPLAGNRGVEGSSQRSSGGIGGAAGSLPVNAAKGVGSSSSSANGGGAWGWQPRWQAPAALHELTGFAPPVPHGARRPAAASADIICALEFERHGWLLACAGVSKQVRVYSLASRLQQPESEDYLQPLRCHRMYSKLSSLAWNPDAPGAVTVGDYDGVVAQMDMESGHLIAEADGHCGRRVWSVSHSLQRPHLCASASDDGTVRLWGGRGMQTCLAALRPSSAGAPACGVQLSPFDGNLLAVASADHSAYVFDLRRADAPVLQLSGHARAVSFVRWLGPSRLAASSTDASLAIWQLPAPADGSSNGASSAAAAAMAANGASAAEPALAKVPSATTVLSEPVRRLRGHQNSKNFCGLSVRPEDGLLACGSESPAAFAYHASWTAPMAVHQFAAAAGSISPGGADAGACSPSQQQQQQQGLFCSAVAWQPVAARPGRAPLLAAALSSGELRIMELGRPQPETLASHGADG